MLASTSDRVRKTTTRSDILRPGACSDDLPKGHLPHFRDIKAWYRSGIVKLDSRARFSTVCLHAGQEPDPSTGAIITPIYQTATYVQDELGRHKGFEYGRTQNPTRLALERNIAAMEGGREAFAFASGMAAIGAVATMLTAGDHVIVSENTYGGTFRLFEMVLTRYQLSFSYVDTADLGGVERAITAATRMLFVETPTNPIMRLTDLAAAATLAHAHGLRFVVDNTFASPAIQRPIEAGADLVVHSTTKYLNGHSDSIGGIVVAASGPDVEWLRFVQNACGAILSPFDSWLVLRGTKTLPLRMRQHNANGLALAEFLSSHPKVREVFYPGLPSHPQHALAARQMDGFGGMLAFDVGSLEAARAVLNGVRLIALAESLGGVESLISHPATMTHASVPVESRLELGITDGLVRISVGIEDIDDLRDDVGQALDRIGRT
jgi:cystathionine gamma-lyase/cystathionine beta-lyase/cystathionine gamma-lyase/homocysteine desulfhydrase